MMATHHQPAGRLWPMMISNGQAAGIVFGLFVIAILLDSFVWMGILGVAPPFAVFMLGFSLINAWVIRSPVAEAWGWYASIAMSWALTAPFSSWLDNVLVQADPHVYAPGPPEFNAALWYWSLIPVAVYAATGALRYRRLARNVGAAAEQ